ncbi:LuxR C-terminal-related transcriptional regulator [Caniella muris]|uniref:LuxR C-terminal-related transcriptional regulator n=1 Tax=Caniella muris TaxID=2941502 RepID=UPI00203F8070|nr:LuxR C-terminal-related transcriptional regulator [Caniella muris]
MVDKPRLPGVLLLLWGALLFGAAPLVREGGPSLAGSGYCLVALGLVGGAAAAIVADRRVGEWRLSPWRAPLRRVAALSAAAALLLPVAVDVLPPVLQEPAQVPSASPLLLLHPPVLLAAASLGAFSLVDGLPTAAPQTAAMSPVIVCADAVVAGSSVAVAWATGSGAPFVPAAGGLLCVAAVRPLSREEAARAVGAFSLGPLVAGSLGRVAPLPAVGALLLAVLGALVALGVGARLASLRPRREEPAAPASTPAPAPAVVAASLGLSEREQEAVACLLQGMTSEESAAVMGVKAPTVRTYLRRACQKAGVTNGDALRSLLGEGPAEEDGPASAEPVQAPASALPAAWALTVLTVLLLVAPMGRQSVWGAGTPQVIGCAWGLAAFALLGRRAGCRVSDLVAGSAAARAVAGGAAALALTVACALGAATLDVTMPAAPSVALTACLSRGAAVALCLWGLRWAISVAGAFPHPARFVVAGVAGAVCTVSQAAWLAAMAVALLGVVGFGTMAWLEGCPGPHQPKGDAPTPRLFTLAVWGVAGIGSGLLLEEGWRLLNATSLAHLVVPLAAGLAAVTPWLAPRSLASRPLPRTARAVLTLIAATGSVTLAATRPQLLLFSVVGLLLGTVAAVLARSYAPDARGALGRCVAAGTAGGMLAAFLGASVHGDVTGYNQVALEAVGGIAMVHGLAAYAVGTVSLVAVVAWCAALHGAGVDGEALHRDDGDADDAVRAWLESAGLGALQCEVALGIYRNESGPELSERLNYSRSYINNIRNSVYRQLGVHGRAELVDAITRAKSL